MTQQMHFLVYFAYIIICRCFVIAVTLEKTSEQPKIGIIGGGIGGTSCAHYLRSLFGDASLIDLYEFDEIGGRLATVEVGGNSYESGGSIIHPANEYMLNFIELLNLRKTEEVDGQTMGIYDGEKFVFRSSSWDALTLVRLLWHYGWDIIRIEKFVKQLISDFGLIYSHQAQSYAFTTVENLLKSMSPNFVKYMNMSIESLLSEEGFSSRFINELAMGAMRTNYGQGTNVNGFVGAVSLAGIQPGLWSVAGGNKLVPLGLLAHSKAEHYKAKINKIVLKPRGNTLSYSLEAKTQSNEITEKEYDIVIIATPLSDDLSNIIFKGFPDTFPKFQLQYHRTVATFVSGVPNSNHFSLSHDDHPTAILTSNSKLYYKSIGKHLKVDWTMAEEVTANAVYKVFTHERMSESQLVELFSRVDNVTTVDWKQAYPNYERSIPETPHFQLHSNLYYVNAIECAASAMEMSAIGGRNVAILAYNRWHGYDDKVDHSFGGSMHLRDDL